MVHDKLVFDERAQMRVRIAEMRKKFGIRQNDLAQLIGVSRPYLAQIENGTRNLSVVRQSAIAKALEIDPARLIDFDAPDQDDEEYLIQSFRRLRPEQRKEWLDLARVATGIAQRKNN